MIRHGLKGTLGTVAATIIMIAGPVSEGWAALSYDLSLGAGALINDNLHLDPRTPVVEGEAGLRQPVKETILVVTPGVELSWFEGRDRLALKYGGEYSTYTGDEKRDPAWVHTITADLRWRRWSPFFLEAQESRSRVPRTQEREGEAFVDQVDRNLLSARTGLAAAIGPRSTFELAYRVELETYSVVGSADPVKEETDAGIGEFDRIQRHYGQALVRYPLTPLWGSEFSVAYGQVARDLASDHTEFRASVALSQRWSEHLALRYRLEWRREAGEKPAVEDPAAAATEATEATEVTKATETPEDTVHTRLLLGVEISGDLERGGSWTLAYQDTQQDQPDGDTFKTGRASATVKMRDRLGSTLDVGGWHETRDYQVSGRAETAWGPTLAMRWVITPWSAFDLGGSWTNTTIREKGLDEVTDRTTRASAGLVIFLFKRVQFEMGYRYQKNDSTDELRSYANNLVFALLTFHFRSTISGRIPSSYASGLVAGDSPSGGTAQIRDDGAAGMAR